MVSGRVAIANIYVRPSSGIYSKMAFKFARRHRPFKNANCDAGRRNNETLLNDRLYVGWPHKRVRGEDYDRFIGRFVQFVRKYHPHSLLHFEDFGVNNAKRLLDLYHDKHAMFNDDVQGTDAMTLATVM
ncbi:hypothetical protein AcV5_005243 [Taiwanofungus camphoratus]|nr:hypothetical protein AcW2_000152 [Antrodia cinnamomea]KAI0937303.1 hypothetical protein AcV5_005243 [Antrodia cinnamomea]KAI0962513.1 hypothetical protein AcV7_001344 [Antrodia cinnamomea]